MSLRLRYLGPPVLAGARKMQPVLRCMLGVFQLGGIDVYGRSAHEGVRTPQPNTARTPTHNRPLRTTLIVRLTPLWYAAIIFNA